MTLPANSPSSPTAPGNQTAWYSIFASAAIILIGQLHFALTTGINWDEFQQYDSVRRLAAGTLEAPLQTFHSHLFGWLLHLPGDVTDHIHSARVIMLLCEVGTAIALFGLARRFASNTAAALISLAYLSGGYVVTQANAFRADPQAALLLMTALWLLACRPLRPAIIVLFGALAGLAAMLTIKVVFYAPAFAGIAWLRWQEEPEKRQFAAQLIACVVASLSGFAMLYAWHTSFLAEPQFSTGAKMLGSAWKVVFSEGLFPRWPFLVRQLLLAPHISMLLALSLIMWPKLHLSRAQRLAMAGLMLPLIVLLPYRNSYPYFFVFLLPPILVATAPVMDQIVLKRYGTLPIAATMAVIAVFLAFYEPRGILENQKRVIAMAHRIFPEPVTYFDECGYLGDYDRALTFMPSGWGLSEYRRKGIPQFVEIMQRKTVPLLIANQDAFTAALENISVPGLLEPDARALRENYIHHWGVIWVAGRHIPAGPHPLTIHVRIPGQYTLENGGLILDGVSHKPGDIINLKRGIHAIGAPRPHAATLRWGRHLMIPSELAPDTSPLQLYQLY